MKRFYQHILKRTYAQQDSACLRVSDWEGNGFKEKEVRVVTAKWVDKRKFP